MQIQPPRYTVTPDHRWNMLVLRFLANRGPTFVLHAIDYPPVQWSRSC